MKRRRIVATLGIAITLCAANVSGMSFWGDGSPSTNRVPPAASVQALPNFSSSAYFLREFVLSPFSSMKPGFLLFLR